MSLGRDVIGRSERERAIIVAALRTANQEERALLRAELECMLHTVDKEIGRIPPRLLPSSYHRQLIKEKECITELIEKIVNDV